MQKLIVNSDGGSRGNPGPAACGAVIYDTDGRQLIELAKTIGITTNNQAEYQALEMALSWIKDEFSQAVVNCRLDSELVVNQLIGRYRLKNLGLRPHFEEIKRLVSELGGAVSFVHIPREENQLADQLVNRALDGR